MIEKSSVDALIHRIIDQKLLTPLYQPIVDLKSAKIFGYSGLIRGPSDSNLHSPDSLFRAAEVVGAGSQVEELCWESLLKSFVTLDLSGKVFLKVSPGRIAEPDFNPEHALHMLGSLRLNPDRVIVEISDDNATYGYKLVTAAALRYRAVGFEVAMNDTDQGFSGLRMWSDVRPEYVKVTRHLVQGVHHDPAKIRFLKSVLDLAERNGGRVIAEGVETESELLVLKDLGISYGQGYYIGRPSLAPATTLDREVSMTLSQGASAGKQTRSALHLRAENLLIEAPAVGPQVPSEVVLDLFLTQKGLHAVAVVQDEIPIGLVNRNTMIDQFSKIYTRELFGRKPCSTFMETAPLIVSKDTGLEELGPLVVSKGRRYFSDGFIITDKGKYLGLGSGYDLMREITAMQINVARQANPLTMLPGNAMISQHIEYLVSEDTTFCACYCDLDHFKAFNDRYGYHKGDEVIRLLGHIIVKACDEQQDFVGHIGGDDFFVVFRSRDWERRCEEILAEFDNAIVCFFNKEDIAQRGYKGEDRTGKLVFHPLPSLSIGAVAVDPKEFSSHHAISDCATDAKRQAKRLPGSKLYIERTPASRQHGCLAN